MVEVRRRFHAGVDADEQCNGARRAIVTRVQKDGTKRYATVIRINGKQQWKTFTKKRDAEDYLDRSSPDIREGTYREIKKATFASYIDGWKKKHLIAEKLKPATLNSYGSNIEKHLIPTFGPRSLLAIDSDQITAFESKLLTTEKQSPKSTRNILHS